MFPHKGKFLNPFNSNNKIDTELNKVVKYITDYLLI